MKYIITIILNRENKLKYESKWIKSKQIEN